MMKNINSSKCIFPTHTPGSERDVTSISKYQNFILPSSLFSFFFAFYNKKAIWSISIFGLVDYKISLS